MRSPANAPDTPRRRQRALCRRNSSSIAAGSVSAVGQVVLGAELLGHLPAAPPDVGAHVLRQPLDELVPAVVERNVRADAVMHEQRTEPARHLTFGERGPLALVREIAQIPSARMRRQMSRRTPRRTARLLPARGQDLLEVRQRRAEEAHLAQRRRLDTA